MLSLLDLLADDLLSALAVGADDGSRRVLLWLDPERQFARLVPYLESALGNRGAQLLRYALEDGQGQVALKLALLRLEQLPGARGVVYLPGFAPAALEPRPESVSPVLWSVYEYRYKGRTWRLGGILEPGAVPESPALLEWLATHGVRVVGQKARRDLVKGGPDSLLARYAEHERAKTIEDWPNPLRVSDAETIIEGNPRDALRRLFAAPANEARIWGEERSSVLSGISKYFGLKVQDPNDPEAVADHFALDLALTEAWDAFGRPDDFPFVSRLPARAEHRQRQAAFLRDDVLSHTNLGPLFRQRVAGQEPQYDLSAWASVREGQPGGLPGLARSRWVGFWTRFEQTASTSSGAALDLVKAERDAIGAAASAPWGHLDPDTHWGAMRDLVDLADQAEAAVVEGQAIPSAAGLVVAYADRWLCVDRLHLRVRAAAAAAGLNALRQVSDAAYFTYVDRLADRFGTLVQMESTWPPNATTPVESLQAGLWSVDGKHRRAILVTDACRWDLAIELQKRLGPVDCTLAPVLSTLPSNTPFGMAALLPLGRTALSVKFAGGKPAIKANTGGAGTANLATRDGRKTFLQSVLRDKVEDRTLVEFLDLTALLNGAKVPSAPIVVVFDNDLDEQGHKGTEQLPALVETFIGEWRRAITALHDAGIGTVHLVTDHGFLLLPPHRVEALGTPQVAPMQALYKHMRWAALKPDAPTNEVLKLPLPAAPTDVTLGIPRGVRTLVKPEPYLHGGISLQECVIPHLVSRRALVQQRVGVDVEVTTSTLTGGTVPVRLTPSLSPGQAPLGGLQPVTVKLWVETVPDQQSGAPKVVAGPCEQPVSPDAEQLKPPIFLQPGLDLRAGQPLRLRAVDAESGRDLATVNLTLAVDWE